MNSGLEGGGLLSVPASAISDKTGVHTNNAIENTKLERNYVKYKAAYIVYFEQKTVITIMKHAMLMSISRTLLGRYRTRDKCEHYD